MNGQAAEELVRDNVGLVFLCSSRFEGGRDEWLGSGALGLIKAAEDFSPSRGVAFSTYAMHRIRGAILDDARNTGRTKRSLCHKRKAIAKAYDACVSRGNLYPKNVDLAAEVGVSLKVFNRWKLDLDFGDPVRMDGKSPARLPRSEQDVYAEVERKDLIESIKRILKALPDRDGEIVLRHFLGEEQLYDIAKDLGMTKSRVCQIKKYVLEYLRELL